MFTVSKTFAKMYWDNFIEKSGRSHKYIRRIPKNTGKGYNYIYPKDFKNPLKSLTSIFGIKEEKITDAYVRNNIQSAYGVTKNEFGAHILEYLSNKKVWDKFFSDKFNRDRYKTPSNKKEKSTNSKQKIIDQEKKEKQTITSNDEKNFETKWNNSLMRKIYSMYNSVPEDKKTESKNTSTVNFDVGERVSYNGAVGSVTKLVSENMVMMKFDDGGFARVFVKDLQKLNPTNQEVANEADEKGQEQDINNEHGNKIALLDNDNAKKEVIEDPIAQGYKYNYDGKVWTVVGFGENDAPILLAYDGTRIEFDSMEEFDSMYQSGEITNAADNGLSSATPDTSLSNEVSVGKYTISRDNFDYLMGKVGEAYATADGSWDESNYARLMANEIQRDPLFMQNMIKIIAGAKVKDFSQFMLDLKTQYDNGGKGYAKKDFLDERGQQKKLEYKDIVGDFSKEELQNMWENLKDEREKQWEHGITTDLLESYVHRWSNAIHNGDTVELYKIFSLLEDENYHTEGQLLLDGNYSELYKIIENRKRQDEIWKMKNGILDRIKNNQTVGDKFFDELRETAYNTLERDAIDEAEKQYKQDKEMEQYRLESDRWDEYNDSYNKTREDYKNDFAELSLEEIKKLRDEISVPGSEEMYDIVTSDGSGTELGEKRAKADMLDELIAGYQQSGGIFAPSVIGNLPSGITLADIEREIKTQSPHDVMTKLYAGKTGYTYWGHRKDPKDEEQWKNVQEIGRILEAQKNGLKVVNGNVISKVKDTTTGQEIKEGDIVKISNSYTKGENGLFRIENVANNGTHFNLIKLNKDGSESKSYGGSWPLNHSYHSNPNYRYEYRKQNGENGENVKIELTTIDEKLKEKAKAKAKEVKPYQFTVNGIRKPDGKYVSVYYGIGDVNGPITVHSDSYGSSLGFLSSETDKVENNSDIMTDYFDKDSITISPSNPYYNQVKRAALKNSVTNMKKQLASAKEDVEKYSGNTNYYNGEYYLKQAQERVKTLPGKISTYEAELKKVEKELKPKTVKKSLFYIKNGRFYIRGK